MEQLFQWAAGNPGALTFLMSLMQPENLMSGLTIISTLEKATSIRGTNIWVLYSDLCGKDVQKVESLCKKCPKDILEDACSRQDYSGRALVSPYL